MSDLRKLLDECTVGPWAVRMCDIESDQCNYDQILAGASFMGVAELAAVNHFFLAHEANARLIALAPDLAAALLKAEEALDEIADRHIPDQPSALDISEDEYVRRQHTELRRTARATLTEIRKLTGAK